jgi:hypothetical protein
VRPSAMHLAPRSTLTAAALALVLGLSACGKEGSETPGSTPGSTGSGSTPPSATGGETRAPTAGDGPAGGSSGFKGSVPAADASGAPSTGGSTAASGGTTATNPSAGASRPAAGVTNNGGLPASQLGSMPRSEGSKNSSPDNSTGNAVR